MPAALAPWQQDSCSWINSPGTVCFDDASLQQVIQVRGEARRLMLDSYRQHLVVLPGHATAAAAVMHGLMSFCKPWCCRGSAAGQP